MHRDVDLHTHRLLAFSTRLGEIVYGAEVALSDCAKVADPDRTEVIDPDRAENLRSDAKVARSQYIPGFFF
jgi:hypothetical protein